MCRKRDKVRDALKHLLREDYGTDTILIDYDLVDMQLVNYQKYKVRFRYTDCDEIRFTYIVLRFKEKEKR